MFVYVVGRYVFIAAMGTLSVAQLYRQITNYGVHAVDFSGWVTNPTTQVRVIKKIVREKLFKLILIPNAIDVLFIGIFNW